MANESHDITRRDFAKAAVAAAVTPALAACATAAPESPPASTPTPTATPAAAPAPAGGQEEPTPLARALMEAVRVQYGDRMTAEEMAKVQRSISGVLSTAERVRGFPLPIGTEPSFVYRVPGGTR